MHRNPGYMCFCSLGSNYYYPFANKRLEADSKPLKKKKKNEKKKGQWGFILINALILFKQKHDPVYLKDIPDNKYNFINKFSKNLTFTNIHIHIHMWIILKWNKPLFRNTNMAAVEHHAKHAKTKEKANQKSKIERHTWLTMSLSTVNRMFIVGLASASRLSKSKDAPAKLPVCPWDKITSYHYNLLSADCR